MVEKLCFGRVEGPRAPCNQLDHHGALKGTRGSREHILETQRSFFMLQVDLGLHHCSVPAQMCVSK